MKGRKRHIVVDVLGCLLSVCGSCCQYSWNKRRNICRQTSIWAAFICSAALCGRWIAGVLSFLIWRIGLILTLIFQRKSSLINGKSSLGDGWWNTPSPGSIIPVASAKIMKFPFPPMSLWLWFLISTRCSNAYEYTSSYIKNTDTSQ